MNAKHSESNRIHWHTAVLEMQRLHAQMVEDSICEVLAWRMFGIDAEFYYIQGEFTVEVNVKPHA